MTDDDDDDDLQLIALQQYRHLHLQTTLLCLFTLYNHFLEQETCVV